MGYWLFIAIIFEKNQVWLRGASHAPPFPVHQKSPDLGSIPMAQPPEALAYPTGLQLRLKQHVPINPLGCPPIIGFLGLSKPGGAGLEVGEVVAVY